jgi:deoxyribonuclease-4
MTSISLGPAGIGSIKDVEETFAEYQKLGFKAAEIPFTYGVYIKENQCEKIKKAAKKYDISLSIHAPYWINLNSPEKEKVEASKQRILKSCKIGHLLGAKKIVFHIGFL